MKKGRLWKGNRKLSDTLGWKFVEKSRGGKLPTFLCEGWKVADTKIRNYGKLPTGERNTVHF